MNTYIITGATGYIGSNIVRSLINAGNDIHIIVRNNSNMSLLDDVKFNINIFIFNGDIESLIEYFKPLKDAIVIHLASLFIAEHKKEQVDGLIDSNIKFGVQLLEAMKEADIKYLINTGTSWQHYKNSTYSPVCLYAATKEAFEKIITYYYEVHGIKNVTLELFDSYGPGDNRPKLLNLLATYSEKDIKLNMSYGEQMLDLVYIDDIVNGYLLTINMIKEGLIGEQEKFVLSSGYRVSLKELVELYREITNKFVRVEWGARPYRNREVMIPWENGTILPNWKTHVSLVEGLIRTFK